MSNVVDLTRNTIAARRLDEHYWRVLVLAQFSDEERERLGDARILETASGARGQVEGIQALRQILGNSPVPYPPDVQFTEEQKLVIGAAHGAHLEYWAETAWSTAIRLAVKEAVEG